MNDLNRIDQKLIDIAAQGGNRLALDSAEEKEAAERLLEAEIQALQESDGDCCIIAMAEQALEAIKQADDTKALFVNPLFGDEPDLGCWPLCLGDPHRAILTPLDGEHAASFRVYSGGTSLWDIDASKVGVTQSEWTYIVEPLVALQRKAEATDAVDEGVVAAERSNDLLSALSDSLGRYETVVGRKAGTDKDIGGFAGNSAMLVGREEGQQDCINELHTARQALAAFQSAGLLMGWRVDPEQSVARISFGEDGGVIHAAPRIIDPDGLPFAVDTWMMSNGAGADIVPETMFETFFFTERKAAEEAILEELLSGTPNVHE